MVTVLLRLFRTLLWRWVFALAVLCAGGALAQSPVVPGQVWVKFKPAVRSFAKADGVVGGSMERTLKRIAGGRLQRAFPSVVAPAARQKRKGAPQRDVDLIYTLHFDAATPVATVLALLRADPSVAYAEPRRILRAAAQPNDPLVPFVAGEPPLYQWNLALVKAPQAWDISQGDSNVVIAVVDDGIQWTHDDLVDNLAHHAADPINGIDDDGNGFIDDYRGWDFAGASRHNFVGDNDPQPADTARYGTAQLWPYSGHWGFDYQYYHGTVVAGYAAAATDNGIGGASAGWRCRLLPIKVAPDTARLDSFLFAPLYFPYEGVVYAADRGADIINCSWGQTDTSQVLADIVAYATAQGSLIVAAAGNSNDTTRYYPAAYPEVLSVASSDTDDHKVPSSTYGMTIDVTAPGRGPVLLPYPWGVYTYGWTNTIGWATSWASPQAASVAALLKAYDPSLTPAQLHARLKATADNIDAANLGYVGQLGAGRINAYQALVGSATGIEPEGSLDEQIRMWPNPADEVVHLSKGRMFGQEVSGLELRDLQGRLVMSEGWAVEEWTKTLSVSGLAPGVYVLGVMKERQRLTYKIVIY